MLTKTQLAGLGRIGALTIGHNNSISAGHLRETIKTYREAFTDVVIRLVEAGHKILSAGLNTALVDLVIGSENIIYLSGLRCDPVWTERLMVAISCDHPLAQQDFVSWPDLASEVIVLTANDLRPAILDQLLGKPPPTGGSLLITLQETSRESMLSMLGISRDISIRCTCGTGVIYPNVAYREVRVQDEQSWVQYSAFWGSENNNPALRRFLGFLRNRHALSFDL